MSLFLILSLFSIAVKFAIDFLLGIPKGLGDSPKSLGFSIKSKLFVVQA